MAKWVEGTGLCFSRSSNNSVFRPACQYLVVIATSVALAMLGDSGRYRRQATGTPLFRCIATGGSNVRLLLKNNNANKHYKYIVDIATNIAPAMKRTVESRCQAVGMPLFRCIATGGSTVRLLLKNNNANKHYNNIVDIATNVALTMRGAVDADAGRSAPAAPVCYNRGITRAVALMEI